MSTTLFKFSPASGSRLPSSSTWSKANVDPRVIWWFNPWTGKARDISDINSDPHGLACVAPGEPLHVAVDPGSDEGDYTVVRVLVFGPSRAELEASADEGVNAEGPAPEAFGAPTPTPEAPAAAGEPVTSEPSTREQWLPEARVAAAQCWCTPETSGVVMDYRLAEAFAQRLAAWMDTGASHARNEAYWRERAEKAERALGELQEAEAERVRSEQREAMTDSALGLVRFTVGMDQALYDAIGARAEAEGRPRDAVARIALRKALLLPAPSIDGLLVQHPELLAAVQGVFESVRNRAPEAEVFARWDSARARSTRRVMAECEERR